MTYERLKQFLILSICSVLLLGLIADEASAQLCAMVGGDGSAVMSKKAGGGCERKLVSDFEGAGKSVVGGYSWGDDNSNIKGMGEKTFLDWIEGDILRGRNDSDFCNNVVEKITGVKCGEDGRYILDADKYVDPNGVFWRDSSGNSAPTPDDLPPDLPQECWSDPTIVEYELINEWWLTGSSGLYGTLQTRCNYITDDGKEHTTRVTQGISKIILDPTDCPSGSTYDGKGCLSKGGDYVSNDEVASMFDDLPLDEFTEILESPAFDQYMDELDTMGISWSGNITTEPKKTEEQIDYHPDGSESLTEFYESKDYSYSGSTGGGGGSNILYPNDVTTNTDKYVDGKLVSSGSKTEGGKGDGSGSGDSGNGSGDGDGPLDAKVDGSQIGLGESPEIPELYQQKYKNTDWAEIVEDGLQDNPMLDNLKGIGSQYTTGVCPSFEQEFFGELIVIDIPCELLDMIRAFFLTISTISAFWIIFRRA